MPLFHGLAAFPLTPADENGRVAVSTLCATLHRLCEAEVDAIGLLGSTGIYAYLSREERRRAVTAAVECVSNRVPVIVGIGALRTDHAQDLARDAATAGADALLLAPVSYTPLTEDEVYEHFRAVASVTDLPLCVYNNPGTTHFTFSRDLLARLARIDSIKAVKMPLPATGDVAGELPLLRRGAELAIGYSGDWGAADALLAGADAWYAVAAGLLPRLCLSLLRAAEAEDIAETRRIDGLLQPLWDCFKAHGSLRVMYALHDVLHPGTTEPPRPVLPLTGTDRRRVEDVFAPLRALEGL
ncbi:dihydrodipicolinate synthase family protein [Aureimonas psammosilenae]|uniref:dihydrodipicolinate synthase family protein n=1 Tax=Aureimonas psammosilenae TaxID=2495496 RepID=UPI00126091D3|nr:dihydrodipicolinate synthase family protein [Aureimonas psammosilenae]